MKHLDKAIVKKEYGFLENIVYVNTCSVGVPPLRTQAAFNEFMEKHYLPLFHTPSWQDFREIRQKTREQLARLVNGSPGEIAFTKNTTEGNTILAQGYDLGPGDNVIICDQENSANLYPWVQASKRRGFELRLLKTDQRTLTAEDYMALADTHTKIISVSVVQAHTGIRIDLPQLGRFCRERGIVLAVDAIQALGRIVVDAEACGIDYLACGGFKGLASGFGIGFIWCRSELIPQITPYSADEDAMEDPLQRTGVYHEDRPFSFCKTAERFEYGSRNTFGIFLMHHSLSLLEELGKEAVEEHILAMESDLRKALQGKALDVLSGGALSSGMVVAHYPSELFDQVEQILHETGIRMTHKPGYLRLCIALYNTEKDMQCIANAFGRIAGL